MNIHKEDWKKLTLPFDADVNDALHQQHHAAQFIALVGRYLIPREPDDSNTNMDYMINEQSLVGNAFADGLRVGLKLNELILHIRGSEGNNLAEFFLAGKTKPKIFTELKDKISELGVNTSDLKNELHYEIPGHYLEKGAAFCVKDSLFFKEAVFYRHNAQIILNGIVHDFPETAPVKVWPHHFDTGTLIPLAYNEEGGMSKSIGLGWAIPDSLVDEPYFYLSFWSEMPVANFDRLPLLVSGQWITSGWQGGVLKLSDLVALKTVQEQRECAKAFFDSGIKILVTHFKN